MFSTDSPVLHIGEVPDRNQVALFLTHEGEIYPLAYFPSDGRAQLAAEMIRAGWRDYVGEASRGQMREAVEAYRESESVVSIDERLGEKAS